MVERRRGPISKGVVLPEIQELVIYDLDDTLAPTIEAAADYIEKLGKIWTRKELVATPLGHNPNPEIHKEQMLLMRNDLFLGELEPFKDASEATAKVVKSGRHYMIWSARINEPKEVGDATNDWIRINFIPPPIGVLLKAESRLPGVLFKGLAYRAICKGHIDTDRIRFMPIAALEDDYKAGLILASQGLNVFMVGRSKEVDGYEPIFIPRMYGPYETVGTATADLLYLQDTNQLEPPKPLPIGRSLLDQLTLFLGKRGFIRYID